MSKRRFIEAVWVKDGKEIESCDPVVSIEVRGETVSDVYVYNGSYEYNEDADMIILRTREYGEEK